MSIRYHELYRIGGIAGYFVQKSRYSAVIGCEFRFMDSGMGLGLLYQA